MRKERHVEIAGQQLHLTEVFDAYWRFAAERQRIFFNRVFHRPVSLTTDPILSQYKFTNAYRASDRVSQYLIKHVIYRDDLPASDEEVFFRIILFKLFNKIETWELLEHTIGDLVLSNFDYGAYDHALSQAMRKGIRIYSAAYIIPSCGNVFGHELKHQNHLKLIDWMLEQDFPKKIASSNSMEGAYETMLGAPSIGSFLAYQFITDINYSEITSFCEDTFVVPGPGALDGVSKCFKSDDKLDPEACIKYMYEHQDQWFSILGEEFQSLWDRKLQLIDCQNLFCEISKYARVAFPAIAGVSGRTRIKQKFSHQRPLPPPWYPPKWGLNDKIAQSLEGVSISPIAAETQMDLF